MLDRVRTEFLREFVRDSPVNPYALLAQLLYVHAFGGIDYSAILLLAGVAFMLIFRKNYFWWWGVLIHPQLGWLAPINLLLGLLSCNERWKTLIFLYVATDALLLGSQAINLVFNILAVAGLLFETYHSIPFSSIHSNKMFFVSFTVVWTTVLCEVLRQQFGLTSSTYSYLLAWVIPLSLLASLYAINREINRMLNGTLEELHHPWQVVHYIENIEYKLQDEIDREGVQNRHRSECSDLDCFCRKPPTMTYVRMYVRFLYAKGFRKFGNTQYDDCLLQFYVMHLIRQGMFPLAVEVAMNSKEKKVSIYKRIKKKRVQFMLQDELRRIEQDYEVKTEFDNPFSYQKCYQLLKRRLLELIETKMEYWTEVSKKAPRVVAIRSLGRKFNKDLNQMQDYYSEEIKNLEKEIRIFSGSIIYNLFLLVATNYKELAESNMKSIRKSNDASSLPSEANRNYRYYTIKASMAADSIGRIENVNTSIGKLLETTVSKEEIIGRSINEFIPLPYHAPHQRAIGQLRSQRANKLMGKEVEPVFFKTFINNIVPTTVLFKYSSDILNELSVIAIIKHVKSDSEWIMLDGNATFQYSSSAKENKMLLDTPEVRELITNFQKKWEEVCIESPRYITPTPMKTQVRHEDSTFTTTIMSPLADSFIFPEKPPLMLSFYNQTTTYFAEEDIVDDMDVGCINKINLLLDQAETDSQASNVGRQSQIISIMKGFEKASVTKIFRQLFLSIMGIFLINAVALSVQNYTVDAASPVPNGQMIELLMIAYDIQLHTTRAASKGLAIYGIRKGAITHDIYGSIFRYPGNYTEYNLMRTREECNLLKRLITTDLITSNDGTHVQLTQVLRRQLTVNTQLSSQSVEALGFLHVMISDCFELANQFPMEKLVTGQVYWQTLFPFYFDLIDIIKSVCDTLVADQNKINYVELTVFLLLVGLCLVPICLANRAIEQKEDYIYELMISIEPDLIDKELSELGELQMSLKTRNNTTMHLDDKQSFNPAAYNIGQQPDTKSQSRGLVDSRKKRASQLNRKGYTRPRWFFILCTIVFGAFICGMFAVKFLQLQTFSSNLSNYNQQFSWRNERMLLLLNIKKKIFGFQIDEPVLGGTLNDWISNTIADRKTNYLQVDSPDYVAFDCSVNNSLCDPSSSLSSELAINVFLETMMSQNNDDLSPYKVPLTEQLEEASSKINDIRYPAIIAARQASIDNFTNIRSTVYIASLSCLLLLAVGACCYLQKFKAEYVRSIRTITFLSEDMIKKNKRVESFLQRLSKHS